MTDDSNDIPDPDDLSIPSSVTEVADRINADRLRTEHVVADYQRQAAERFTEYLLDEAATTLRRDAFDRDTVVDALKRMWRAGLPKYRDDDERVTVHAAVCPRHQRELRESFDEMVRLVDRSPTDRSVVPEGAFVVDIEVDISTTLPDDTALFIHPDAAAPLPPGVSDPARPWLVRVPEGVVVVETGGEK
jgi:hypothetical protein